MKKPKLPSPKKENKKTKTSRSKLWQLDCYKSTKRQFSDCTAGICVTFAQSEKFNMVACIKDIDSDTIAFTVLACLKDTTFYSPV